jgi:pyruvate dehydrogenase E2 component (dihydrolipoamide acetyltransferase)
VDAATSQGASKSLRDRLESFARQLAAADNPRERVSVTVSRQDGFQNEASTPRGLRISLDEPQDFGGRGEAPDPAEFLLAAIGASLSVTLTAHGELRGVAFESVQVDLGGEIDGAKFFEPGSRGAPGVLDMELTLTIATQAPRRAVQAVIRDALRVAPVLKSLKRVPKVRVIYRPSSG